MKLDTEESLLRVLAGPRTLKANRLGDCDLDRVQALAIAQMPAHHARQVESLRRASHDASMVALGRHVLALRIGNEASAYEPLLQILATEAIERLKYVEDENVRYWTSRAVARQAIQEYLVDMCASCSGKGHVPVTEEARIGRQAMTVCPDCAGSRKRRYTFWERAQEMFCKPSDRLVREKVDTTIDLMIEAAKKVRLHYEEVLHRREE